MGLWLIFEIKLANESLTIKSFSLSWVVHFTHYQCFLSISCISTTCYMCLSCRNKRLLTYKCNSMQFITNVVLGQANRIYSKSEPVVWSPARWHAQKLVSRSQIYAWVASQCDSAILGLPLLKIPQHLCTKQFIVPNYHIRISLFHTK